MRAKADFMNVKNADELTWDELREEAYRGSLFFLGVAPLEDHASHLPSGTDPIICDALAYRVAELVTPVTAVGLPESEAHAVMLPLWYQGASALASLGCLRLKKKTLIKALLEYGEELERLGVRRLVLLTSHGADDHLYALNEAARILESKTRMRVISPSKHLLEGFLVGDYDEAVQKRLGRPYTEAEVAGLNGDVHAAGWETALLLHITPHLVGSQYKTLPAHPVPSGTRKRLRALRAHRGYFGTPAVATAELGEAAFEVLAHTAADLLNEFCTRPVRHYRAAPPQPITAMKTKKKVRHREHAARVTLGLAVGWLLFWWWDRPRPTF